MKLSSPLLLCVAGLVAFALLHSVSAGTLYGIGVLSPHLLKVFPNNASTASAGPVIATDLDGQQLSSLDSKNKIFYLIVFNETSRRIQLVGLSTVTGTITRSVNLPFAPEPFVGVGQTVEVMTDTGNVLVSGRDRILGRHHILQVNPVTGNNTVIAAIGDIDVLGGCSAYDSLNKVLWLEYGLTTGGISLFAFSIPSGNILWTIPNILNMETMDFDITTGLIYGVGLQVFSPTNYTRVLLTLDSKTGKSNVIATIPGFYIIESAISAINSPQRQLYVYMQPYPATPTTPFDLVTLNLDTGAVVQAPVAGSGTLTPWSLAYDPAGN